MTGSEVPLYINQMENDHVDESELLVEVNDLDEIPETVETVETNLVILAERLDQLIRWCERLARENQSLNERVTVLQAERDSLREKNEQLRARIDAMVVRLKALGQNA